MRLIFLGMALLASGCFQAAGEPFPTSTQMLTACDAARAAGTPQAQAPDCLRWWAVHQACVAQQVANAINPVAIPLVNTALPGSGPLINLGADFNTTVCKARGFIQ